MAKSPKPRALPARPPKFDLEAARGAARSGPRQGRPIPGEIREAKTPPPEQDQLDRAVIKAYQRERAKSAQTAPGIPRPGETLYAERDPEKEKTEEEAERRFLDLARERFKLAAEAEALMRKEALDDLNFRIGEQWPKDIEMQRQIDGRPCLKMNRLPQFIRQVTNEQRQQRPSIQVNPVGDGADTETAEVLQGVVRHIEVNSDAEIAYDHAFEHMVTCGFGDWRLISEYIDDLSFDQELKIKRIKNPFSVYWDPAAIEADYSDARYCFIIEDVPRSEYKERYPNSASDSLHDFTSIGDNAAEWSSKETIRVAEYFYIKEDERIAVLLHNGEIKDKTEVQEGDEIRNERPMVKRTVMWAKINAGEILEEREWKTRNYPCIPIFRVVGDDLDVNGRRYVAGMVRNAKDPQRMYNYWVSAGTEMIALAPKAPFVGAEGQFEGHEKEWESANVRNLAYLQYKSVSLGQNLAPPPARNTFEPPIQAINLMTKQADLDIKGTTGIYDPSLGQNKQEQSGRAINLLQKQADVTNLNWTDNLARAMRHSGRAIIDVIPIYYDTARIQRIIKPDGGTDQVIVHNGQPDAAQALVNQNIQKVYDLGTGRYDVTISVGPSYQSKRQEAVASQMALVQAYPEVFQVIGDMLVGNMDWPQAKEMSKRLKKMLPAAAQDSDQSDPESQLMKAQAQLQMLSQQHAQLTEQLQQATQIINTKQVENQGRLQIAQMQESMRAEVVKMQEATKLAVAQINASKDAQQSFAEQELKQYELLHTTAHERAMATEQQQHERTMQKEAPKPPSNGSTQ